MYVYSICVTIAEWNGNKLIDRIGRYKINKEEKKVETIFVISLCIIFFFVEK
jgi:hypothetical protein